MTVNAPHKTLILLITCSKDHSRRDMAISVVKNLSHHLSKVELNNSLSVFDNGSDYLDHLEILPAGTKICRSEKNVGYWSAIHWVLNHLESISNYNYEYLYIVESDLLHTDLSALKGCEDFLDAHQDASSVRTQEFSVRNRWRFDKRLSFLPFHVERSRVSLRNVVNGSKAFFKKANGFPGLYLSNLHPKLPALQRIEVLKEVFSRLAKKTSFTEADYFAETMSIKPLIGVLDHGIYYPMTEPSNSDQKVSASWTDKSVLEAIGYEQTRSSKIVAVDPESVQISMK